MPNERVQHPKIHLIPYNPQKESTVSRNFNRDSKQFKIQYWTLNELSEYGYGPFTNRIQIARMFVENKNASTHALITGFRVSLSLSHLESRSRMSAPI